MEPAVFVDFFKKEFCLEYAIVRVVGTTFDVVDKDEGPNPLDLIAFFTTDTTGVDMFFELERPPQKSVFAVFAAELTIPTPADATATAVLLLLFAMEPRELPVPYPESSTLLDVGTSLEGNGGNILPHKVPPRFL